MLTGIEWTTFGRGGRTSSIPKTPTRSGIGNATPTKSSAEETKFTVETSIESASTTGGRFIKGGKGMTNYEAIIHMTRDAMENFLDRVYLAGINNGMYAAQHEDSSILDDNPFDAQWLAAPQRKQPQTKTAKGICSTPWWKLSS